MNFKDYAFTIILLKSDYTLNFQNNIFMHTRVQTKLRYRKIHVYKCANFRHEQILVTRSLNSIMRVAIKSEKNIIVT